MNKKEKKTKKNIDALTYLKKVQIIGICGIIFSIILFGYDIYVFDNWVSIVSLIVDGILLLFSIYFIIKSNKLKKREKLAIDKSKNKKKGKK